MGANNPSTQTTPQSEIVKDEWGWFSNQDSRQDASAFSGYDDVNHGHDNVHLAAIISCGGIVSLDEEHVFNDVENLKQGDHHSGRFQQSEFVEIQFLYEHFFVV